MSVEVKDVDNWRSGLQGRCFPCDFRSGAVGIVCKACDVPMAGIRGGALFLIDQISWLLPCMRFWSVGTVSLNGSGREWIGWSWQLWDCLERHKGDRGVETDSSRTQLKLGVQRDIGNKGHDSPCLNGGGGGGAVVVQRIVGVSADGDRVYSVLNLVMSTITTLKSFHRFGLTAFLLLTHRFGRSESSYRGQCIIH